MTEFDNTSMRKPKLTYKLVEQAVELKSHGLSNVDICNALDITEGTFYRWLREDDTKLKRALKQGLKKSEAEYKDQLLQKIEAAAEKPQHWTAAAWILERKYPDEYGKAERTRDEKADDVPHISLGVEVKVTNEGDGDERG